MNSVFVGNSFSMQMLKSMNAQISVEEVRSFPKDAYSVVGHQDTANVLGVQFNRESILLDETDTLYVAQVIGGRLPEGTTTLPEGFSMKILKVTVKYL